MSGKIIKHLIINNALGIQEQDLHPEKLNIISGRKGSGKTSVLDAISKAVTNKGQRTAFVHKDADQAELFIELSDGCTIQRKVKESGRGSLKVQKDCMTASSPQTFLNKLIDEKGFGFNPASFADADPEEQTNQILALVNIEIQKEALEKEFGTLPEWLDLTQHPLKILSLLQGYFKNERTEQNGRVKSLGEELLKLSGQVPEDYDPEAWRNVTINDKFQQLENARKFNRNLEEKTRIAQQSEERQELAEKEYKNKRQESILEHEKEVLGLQKTIDMLQDKINSCMRNMEGKKQAIKQALKDLEEKKANELDRIQQEAIEAHRYMQEHKMMDLAPLEKDAQQAERMKSLVPIADNVNRMQETIEEEKKKALELDTLYKKAKAKPVDLLKNVELPIENLSISESGTVLINGLPIDNLSDGEKIELGVDIARQMVPEDGLKLICINGIEALDAESEQAFYAKIQDDDYQYFVTKVTTGDLKVETLPQTA